MEPLLTRIIDDTALLPPTGAPMEEALHGHRAAEGDRLVGRLWCPVSRLAELRRHLVPEDLIDLVLVADTGPEALPEAVETARREPRVRLRGLQITPDPDADQARAAAVAIARLPSDLDCHIEVRQTPGWRETLDRLAAARSRGLPVGAALRVDGRPDTRGDGAAASPPAQVAAFLTACAERGLPAVFPAGVHRAARRVAPDAGPGGHGLLNLVVAACRCVTGKGSVEEAVAAADARALAEEAGSVAEDAARAARRLLVAIGSGDVRVPRAGLLELGLAGEGTRP
ncbi:hypothetical protein [Thermomonospora catenispora]|uniref:hypothetical protein n=1 Tax=Thermomonospora catenispora TaxID=2493090 RepID=UPI00111E3210|nr:hypothetical protein [Thermomonospora catenispora]TNY36723.1 hypothetical protein EIO00_11745 [Thermomonospora catenispora]